MMKAIKDFCFSASHSLAYVHDDHKCKRLHGHNYRVRIECSGPMNGQDMVVDFDDIKFVVGPIIDSLDHRYLNEVVTYENTTSEWLAKWLVGQIGGRLPLSAVEVWETESCGARIEIAQARK